MSEERTYEVVYESEEEEPIEALSESETQLEEELLSHGLDFEIQTAQLIEETPNSIEFKVEVWPHPNFADENLDKFEENGGFEHSRDWGLLEN